MEVLEIVVLIILFVVFMFLYYIFIEGLKKMLDVTDEEIEKFYVEHPEYRQHTYMDDSLL